MSLSTTLQIAITADTATLALASVAGLVPGDGLTLASETVQVLSVGPGAVVVVTRGVEGTAAVAHAAGIAVVTTGTAVVATGSLLHQVTVVVTDAQLKTLGSGWVDIIPASGAGTVALLEAAYLTFVGAANSYDPVTAELYLVADPDTSSDRISTVTADVIFQVAHSVTRLVPRMTVLTAEVSAAWVGGPVASWANTPIVLTQQSGTNLADGDPGNTLTVQALYYVLNLTTGRFV